MFLTETNQQLLNELEDAYDRYQKILDISIESSSSKNNTHGAL